ncbi:hypothetical protein CS533_01975 [Yersinia bercovieri]|uniref:Uncharacterized protein n=1 Tax=Yersinia bercovieri TaxID=634 RepID=A0A2G4U6B4_YERBE|nr:hypothetical protein CS533_01975 [Yersinia bercovieri]
MRDTRNSFPKYIWNVRYKIIFENYAYKNAIYNLFLSSIKNNEILLSSIAQISLKNQTTTAILIYNNKISFNLKKSVKQMSK